VQGPCNSSRVVWARLETDQTAVELRRVKQTDQNWAVSKEIWSSSYSLCRWMSGIRCGFCMVFMMRLDLSNGLRLVPVHARHSESQCVVDAHLCCPLRRWRLPSLTYPFIDFVTILLHARIACPDCFCPVKPISRPRHLIARALANINKAAPSASIPAHRHTRAAPSHTSVYLFDRRHDSSARPTSLISINTRTPTLAVLSASTLVSSIQQLSSHTHLTAASPVASVASVLHTPESNKSGAC
jgi:hypothetical protein